jgi:hypothetical protein
MYPDFLSTKIFHKGIELPRPRNLYKYFKPDHYSLDSLKNQYLYFSNPINFGDEYDCLISDDVSIKKLLKDSKVFNEELGVCCFSTIPDNDLLWDHYAGGFKGFVIKYKNTDEFIPYGKEATIKSHVIYLNNNGSNHPNFIQTVKSMVGKHTPEVVESWQRQIIFHHELCRKRQIYAYEKEYRFISLFAHEFGRKIKYPIENIDTIYIGNKIKPDYLRKLIQILKNNKSIKIKLLEHDYQMQKIKFGRHIGLEKLKRHLQKICKNNKECL